VSAVELADGKIMSGSGVSFKLFCFRIT